MRSIHPSFSTAWITTELNRSARTFAIVIRVLPRPVRWWIGLSYLIIRGLDDIEDGCGYQPGVKRQLLTQYVNSFTDSPSAEDLIRQCAELGHPDGLTYAQLPRMILTLQHFPDEVQRTILHHCKRIAEYMSRWAESGWEIRNQDDLSEYCYAVAGIPGELMVDLYLCHLPGLCERRAQLHKQSRHLWTVLQISNIVRDLKSDHNRGICFIPRSWLQQVDCSKTELFSPHQAEARQELLNRLCQQAEESIPSATLLAYSIPRKHYGLRMFCSVPLALAIATLQNSRHAQEIESARLKISKGRMWWIVVTSLIAGLYPAWGMRRVA